MLLTQGSLASWRIGCARDK